MCWAFRNIISVAVRCNAHYGNKVGMVCCMDTNVYLYATLSATFGARYYVRTCMLLWVDWQIARAHQLGLVADINGSIL